MSISRTLSCVIALSGCSARTHAPPSGDPPRPALGAPIDRAGRPLTGNALIGLMAPGDVADRRKEAYNRAASADWAQFAGDIAHALGLYDGLDGVCGNQWLADRAAAPGRYRALADLLADDRLWIDSRARVCTQLFAVERAALAALGAPPDDCGGRTPGLDASDVFLSLLVLGAPAGIDDGIARDDRVSSASEFPFLVPP